jgi:hypothetical protein
MKSACLAWLSVIDVLVRALFDKRVLLAQIHGYLFHLKSVENKHGEVLAQRINAKKAGQHLADSPNSLTIIVFLAVTVTVKHILDDRPNPMKHEGAGNANHQRKEGTCGSELDLKPLVHDE